MKTTTAEQDPQAVAKLRTLIENIQVAMLVTVTPEGSLRSRPMMTLEMKSEGELEFITTNDTTAVEDLSAEAAVNVVYSSPSDDRYVSISGQTELDQNKSRLRELWNPAFERYVPKGLDDPRLVILRVRIEYAEYWDAHAGKMTRIEHHTGPRSAPVDEPRRKHAGTAQASAGERPEHTKIDIRATPASG